MNKSKFKSVKFKPFDMELDYQDSGVCECWTNQTAFGNSLGNDVFFTDSCIEAYPELFEVEKADREFEEGAYYKARFAPGKLEIIQFSEDYFYRNGRSMEYWAKEFCEIGEKIEL